MAHLGYGALCCGVVELVSITGAKPEKIMEDIVYTWFSSTPRAYIYFTVVAKARVSGERLADFITENNLGHLRKMFPTRNTNSGNYLHMWVWTVNNKTLKEYGKKHNLLG